MHIFSWEHSQGLCSALKLLFSSIQIMDCFIITQKMHVLLTSFSGLHVAILVCAAVYGALFKLEAHSAAELWRLHERNERHLRGGNRPGGGTPHFYRSARVSSDISVLI